MRCTLVRSVAQHSTSSKTNRMSILALLDAPNLVLTPHIASAGEATRDAMGILAVDNAAAVLAGRAPLTPVR